MSVSHPKIISLKPDVQKRAPYSSTRQEISRDKWYYKWTSPLHPSRANFNHYGVISLAGVTFKLIFSIYIHMKYGKQIGLA